MMTTTPTPAHALPEIHLKAHMAIAPTLSRTVIQAFVDFIGYVAEREGIEDPIVVKLMPKPGELDAYTTGAYDRISGRIMARYEGRAVVDVCRTIAHELVHQRQRQEGAFNYDDAVQNIGGAIEDEANARAGELIKAFVKERDARWLYNL